jgi:hypothetical protein
MSAIKATYTPEDEPYLGRELLFHFDNLIINCLEENAKIAPYTHTIKNKSDLQTALSQIIPQAISIALSIRELLRQGYLYGAFVLIRPLAERTITALFLLNNCKHNNKYGIDIWKNGWKYRERPGFQKMIDIISQGKFPGVTELYNSLTHGDPDSAMWNTIQLENGVIGYSVTKIVNNPALCDEICLNTLGWLAAIMGIAAGAFPEAV